MYNKKLAKLLKRCQKEGTLNDKQIKIIIFLVVFAAPERAGAYVEISTGNLVDIRQIKLKVGWNKMKPADRVNNATARIPVWTASTYCPQPFPPNIPKLLDYQGLIDVLKAALQAVTGKKATTTQSHAITKASKNLLLASNQIMSVWQNKIFADPANAIAIADDGGFEYSFAKGRGPRKSGLFKTTETGVLLGQLTGAGGRQWQSTADLGVTIVAENPTSSGITIMRGLTTDKKYGLRGKKVLTKGRYGDWSAWMWETAP